MDVGDGVHRVGRGCRGNFLHLFNNVDHSF